MSVGCASPHAPSTMPDGWQRRGAAFYVADASATIRYVRYSAMFEAFASQSSAAPARRAPTGVMRSRTRAVGSVRQVVLVGGGRGSRQSSMKEVGERQLHR